MTWLGLMCGMIESITRKKSSAGISGTCEDDVQSLPQCRQCTLQRRVDSQNNCRSGCSSCRLCLRSRSNSKTICCRVFTVLRALVVLFVAQRYGFFGIMAKDGS